MKWFYVLSMTAMVFVGMFIGVRGFLEGDNILSSFGEYMMDVFGVLLIVILIVSEAFPQLM